MEILCWPILFQEKLKEEGKHAQARETLLTSTLVFANGRHYLCIPLNDLVSFLNDLCTKNKYCIDIMAEITIHSKFLTISEGIGHYRYHKSPEPKPKENTPKLRGSATILQ